MNPAAGAPATGTPATGTRATGTRATGTPPVFKGVGVPLVTLFDESGELDALATAELAARLVGLGVAAIIVAGTTGEGFCLDPDERIRLLEAVRQAVPGGRAGRVPLIAGTGAPSARQAARLTSQARDAGADAVLPLSPRGALDPRPYYEAVAAAAGDIPVLAYHFPNVSAPGIAVEALAGLPVVGLKDSSGDASRLLATLNNWDRPVYPGSAALITLAAGLGCPGVILGLANAEPELCLSAFGGDTSAVVKLAKIVGGARPGPQGVKDLVAARFGYSSTARQG